MTAKTAGDRPALVRQTDALPPLSASGSVLVHLPGAASGTASGACRASSRRSRGRARSHHLHQLRHTYATALVNAGVSLQALMALLGHMSAEMGLRYGRLFDTTIRAEYERALDLAKQQARIPATGRISLPLADITGGAGWKDTPLIKSRISGGSVSARWPRAPAPTPTFASTAPASTLNPAHRPSSPLSALMPKLSPMTPRIGAGSPKPNGTADSSPDSIT
ncbi:tyrosine-type recombinase/integrase [Streptosporangium sp. NPDC006007]|uniref:tyrosine-type recombinase/integrase n=1 Tax=Streptosporangium sp. NPDC006007 TaxID=3154575 RepID=UPI0033A19924